MDLLLMALAAALVLGVVDGFYPLGVLRSVVAAGAATAAGYTLEGWHPRLWVVVAAATTLAQIVLTAHDWLTQPNAQTVPTRHVRSRLPRM